MGLSFEQVKFEMPDRRLNSNVKKTKGLSLRSRLGFGHKTWKSSAWKWLSKSRG